MEKSFVIVSIDLYKEMGIDQGFKYRAYVNNELFTERTWIWPDHIYIEENLQIEAVPGEYTIHFTVQGAGPNAVTVKEMRVVEGPGRISEDKLILEQA